MFDAFRKSTRLPRYFGRSLDPEHLRAASFPVLALHGEDDQLASIEASAWKAIELLSDGRREPDFNGIGRQFPTPYRVMAVILRAPDGWSSPAYGDISGAKMQMDHDRNNQIGERTVLVFGATGQQGGAVVRGLLSKSRSVRAIVRDPKTIAAKALAAAGVEVVYGDFDDILSIRKAVSGVDGVFSVQPNSGNPGSGITDEDEIRYGKLIADLSVEAAVKHLVYSSASIISRGPTGVANLDCKREIEDHVRALPMSTTIVRPATFMELLARPDFWSSRDEFSFFMDPDKPVELIAADDIGKVAAKILDDSDRFAGMSINIAGDEITGAQIADAFTKSTNRPVTYRRFPDAILERQPALKKTVELFNTGFAAGNADSASLTRLFGPLTGLEEWLAGSGRNLVSKLASTPSAGPA